MKKLVLLVLGFSLALGLSAQRNTFYYGDKDAREINSSIKLFDQLIADYEVSAEDLQRENEKMVADFQEEGGEQFAATYAKKTAVNDSLIGLYRSKILDIKETKQMFLEITAGSSKKRAVQSRGNNPAKLAAAADAYSLMSYTDAYLSGNSNFRQEGKMPDSGLTGLIVNEYYQDLIVTVHGPGSWTRQFSVSRDGGQATFSPPAPGRYIFSFSNGRETKSVVGTLHPGLSEFYDKAGNAYDLMATMPRGY